MTLFRDDGYTLIELVVVLLLAGLVGVAAAGGLQFGTRIWERSNAHLEQDRETASSQAILRSVLASAIPGRKDGFVAFRGDRKSLSFDASALPALGSRGLVHMDIVLERNDADDSLRLAAKSLLDPKAGRTAILADHVSDMQFAYLDTSGKLPVWLAFWRDRDRLPDAIRLEGAAPWPVLTVRLPIAQDANCAFDPVSTTCRRS